MSIATWLWREQPNNALICQEFERINEYIDQVTIVITPPQQHDVNNVVVLKVDELRLGY